ncbi:twin-arginine translocase subunit TatC [Staphylococcus aureus]|uniref:twin-arginine translocase subunit TatC n=1 Tax=Staphylococcus aureus TaxID=1280 RepID=UPI000DBE5F5A|nr:twin-arginine translocase subunit TatC [Staphylococcus aureus]
MVHFSELRHRLVKILLSFVITVIVVYVSSFWWMTPFITYITRAHVSLHAFSFTEMIQIYVMIIFFIAFCFISPVMFYQLWAFIAPGLHNNERQFIYKYIYFACFVLASIIAPPDLTLNILLTLPLILLFEFSMFIVKFTCRGKPPTH